MNEPLVTLIMPIRNEAGFIEESLGAALAQDYPPERLQVIVADGQSSDGTRDSVQALQAIHPNLELIDNPGRIVSTGLNSAVRAARGDVIVRVDGHTVIEPDYVRRCVEELEATGADNVGGMMVGVGNGPFARAVALATSCPFGVGGARFHYSDKKEWVDTVYMGAWRRSVFDRIGLFDEEMVRSQDCEFNYRLRQAGGRILLSPRIRSHYAVRSRPKSLASQYFQYGYWKVRVIQKHRQRMRPHQFVPPSFVFVVGTLASLSLFFRVARRSLGVLLAVYALGITVATHGLAKKCGPGDRSTLAEIPVVFSLLHLAYGAGFLWGLFRLRERWKKAS